MLTSLLFKASLTLAKIVLAVSGAHVGASPVPAVSFLSCDAGAKECAVVVGVAACTPGYVIEDSSFTFGAAAGRAVRMPRGYAEARWVQA